MPKSQKEAVIEEIIKQIPTFNKNVDNAQKILTADQLESIKNSIADRIVSGEISYGKASSPKEIRAYARSMVMNHLKKAKELNGNSKIAATSGKNNSILSISKIKSKKQKIVPVGVDADLLPSDLLECAKNLI